MIWIKKFLGTDGSLWFTLPVRLALGLVFIGHGGQKMFGWFGGGGFSGVVKMMEKLQFSPTVFWAAMAAGGEFFGGVLVLIGLGTRFGALSIAIAMAIAVLKVHNTAFFLTKNGMEFALTLLLAAIALLISGGGALSLDALFFGKHKKPEFPGMVK